MAASRLHGPIVAIGAVVLIGILADPARGQTGAEVLARAGCTACHGPDGSGTALAPAIAGTSMSLAQFSAAVRTARGTMPSFSAAVLPDDRLAELHAYLAREPGIAHPSGRPETGAERYEQVGCYSCHSNQGQGGTQGPRLAPQPVRWERFAWYVRHPSGQMPPYTETVLSTQDLADIYAFLSSRPSPRPLSDIPLLAP